MLKNTEALRNGLSDELSRRQAVMWDEIKALPQTPFNGMHTALEAVIKLGKEAEENLFLLKALNILSGGAK